MNLMLLFIVFILIPIIMFILNTIISKKMMKSREKNSSFECGFDPLSNARIPFSVQFFLISLMFLIFDIEIALLIPFTYIFLNFSLNIILSFLIFLIILIMSIYFEYMEMMIEWKF